MGLRPRGAQFLLWEYVNGIFVAVYNLEAVPNPDLGQNTNLRLTASYGTLRLTTSILPLYLPLLYFSHISSPCLAISASKGWVGGGGGME
jgi:hypothetical protein